MAIVPAKKGEEDKIAQGLMRLSEEDPTLQFATNNETHEMILSAWANSTWTWRSPS